MILVNGASMYQIHPRIEGVFPTLDRISQKHANRQCIITCGRDGIHGVNSLHYLGRAIDIRTKDIQPGNRQAYADEIREALGPGFDVVLEATHVHIEWDPKEGEE